MVKGIGSGSHDREFSGQSIRRDVVDGAGEISDPCTVDKQVWKMLRK